MISVRKIMKRERSLIYETRKEFTKVDNRQNQSDGKKA